MTFPLPDLSPADVAAAIVELDAIEIDGELPADEWFDRAVSRCILQLYVIRSLLASESWELAVDGLMMMQPWLLKMASNAISQMTREDQLDMIRRQMERIQGIPLKYVGELGDLVAFQPDTDPIVPDSLPPDLT
jgi:hypothetical protein